MSDATIPQAPITNTTPLRLKEAVRLAFPAGGMTVSGLRREAARGRLEIEVIAGKQFTTLHAIERMRQLCRDSQKEPASGLSQKNVMRRESSPGERHGSFETERVKSALAALKQTAKGLSKPSPNTSPENTKSPERAAVIRLKS